MVEIEEVKDKKKEDETAQVPPGMKKRVPRKDLPSVSHLLAHGSPEAEGRPKTFCSQFGYPIFIAIVFTISLLIFHYAPHEKSVQPRGKFKMNKRPPPQYKQQQQMSSVVEDQAKQADPAVEVPPPEQPKTEDAVPVDNSEEL